MQKATAREVIRTTWKEAVSPDRPFPVEMSFADMAFYVNRAWLAFTEDTVCIGLCSFYQLGADFGNIQPHPC